MKWSVGSKIGFGFALALAISVVIGGVSYHNTSQLVESAERATHSYQTLENLETLLSVLEDAETGQRGYIITGEERYLEPYNGSLGTVDQVLKNLRKLIGDNGRQLRRLDNIEPLTAQKLAELKETIELRKAKGFDAALQVVASDRGKKFMDEIRKLIAEMKSEEDDFLRELSKQEKALAQTTEYTVVLGTVAAVVLLTLIGFLITRNISGPLRKISSAAEKIAVGDLVVNVSSNGRADEVGILAKAFSRMTVSLQGMATVAGQIAARDLRVQVNPQSGEDVLGNAFHTMVENLRQTTSELSQGVYVLASSCSEILASSTQVASGAAEVGAAIAETVSTIEEVKQTAHVSSQKAQSVSDNAQNATRTAEEPLRLRLKA
jgi:CHASE3 domain sensor protein